MRLLNPADRESRLLCDVCGRQSQIFPDSDLDAGADVKQGWKRLPDRQHPLADPIYYACPACPGEALQAVARTKREQAQAELDRRKGT